MQDIEYRIIGNVSCYSNTVEPLNICPSMIWIYSIGLTHLAFSYILTLFIIELHPVCYDASVIWVISSDMLKQLSFYCMNIRMDIE